MYTNSTDAMFMAQYLRVLLVEDSKVLTERLTEAIRQIPQVELIGTADTEATAVASAQRDSIDVIILDLHLKQGTGFGVMRALATAQLKPRIIVLTNYDLPEYKNAAIALGATHFLDKARDYGRLPEVLHEICEAHLAKHCEAAPHRIRERRGHSRRLGHEHSRQWNHRGHDGAAGARAAHVPAAAERHDAVAHRCEAVGCDGLEPIRRDSLAVIRHTQHEAVAIDADDQVRGLGLRVLEDVRQGLLGDTENSDRGIGIEFGLGIGNRFGALESGATAGL